MKRNYLITLIALFAATLTVNAQNYIQTGTTPASGNIYHTSGNIGIGTPSPSADLHIYDMSKPSIMLELSDRGRDDVNWQIYGDATDGLVFLYSDRGSKSYLTQTGDFHANQFLGDKVGIGTDNPSQKLEVVDGSVFVHGSEGGQGRVVMRKDGNGGHQYEWYPQDAGFYLYDRTSEQFRMTIKNDGKIGFGTTSPEAAFHINKSTNDFWTVRITNSGGQAKGLQIKSGSSSSITPIMQLDDYFGNTRMIVQSNGDIKMYKQLWVKDEIIVQQTDPWPDYVFASDYKLLPLNELESFINANKHLPEVPSAETISETGVELAKMNTILLKKVEELTLYTIEQDKRIKELESKIETLTEFLSK